MRLWDLWERSGFLALAPRKVAGLAQGRTRHPQPAPFSRHVRHLGCRGSAARLPGRHPGCRVRVPGRHLGCPGPAAGAASRLPGAAAGAAPRVPAHRTPFPEPHTGHRFLVHFFSERGPLGIPIQMGLGTIGAQCEVLLKRKRFCATLVAFTVQSAAERRPTLTLAP